MDEKKMQLRFEFRAFKRQPGKKKLSCLVAQDRAEKNLAETWEDAADDMVKKIISSLFSFRRDSVTESIFSIVLRSSALEFKESYYEIVHVGQGQKSSPVLTLGDYRKDRGKEIQTFSVPGARWRLDKDAKKITAPVAKVTMSLDKDNPASIFGILEPEVGFDTGTPVLTFAPRHLFHEV